MLIHALNLRKTTYNLIPQNKQNKVGETSGDALECLQREEQQWKFQMTKRHEETDRKYKAAKQAVDRLYADYQDQQLNLNVEITDITVAQNLM